MKRWILCFLLLSTAVRAEFFIDAYGGMAQVQSGSFYAWRTDDPPGSSSYDGGDLSGSTSFAGGLRGGYWFRNPNWLGLALDSSGFEADSKDSGGDVSFSATSLMLMIRYPLLVSEEFTHGRFQPYAGVGISYAGGDISSSSVDNPESLDADSGSGAVFCTGAKWFITRHFGVLAEYRYVSISFDQNNAWQSGGLFLRTDHYYEAEAEAKAHLLMGGITFHF